MPGQVPMLSLRAKAFMEVGMPANVHADGGLRARHGAEDAWLAVPVSEGGACGLRDCSEGFGKPPPAHDSFPGAGVPWAVGEAPDDIRNCFQQRSRWAKVCSGLTEGALTCMSSLCVLPTGTQVAKSCTHAGPLPVHPEPQALAAAAAGACASSTDFMYFNSPWSYLVWAVGTPVFIAIPRPHHLAR